MFAIPGQTLDSLARDPGRGGRHGQRTSLHLRGDLRGGHAALRPTPGGQDSVWMKTWPAPCTRNWSSAPRRPASNNTKSPTSPARTQSTPNYPLSTSPVAPAATTSITGGEAPSTGWVRAPPPTSAACAPRTAPTRSSTVSNSNRASARSNRARNWPRWRAPGRPPPLACGWSRAGLLKQFRQVTGYDLRREWAEDMNQLVQQGSGRILPDRFQLTPEGLRFADAAAQLFLR